MAREIIVVLFTTTYEASVPIFMLWSLTILASVLAVDGVLRVFAQTRYLVAQNVVHLAIVAALVGPFLTYFGLGGAVLVTLLATAVVKTHGGEANQPADGRARLSGTALETAGHGRRLRGPCGRSRLLHREDRHPAAAASRWSLAH